MHSPSLSSCFSLNTFFKIILVASLVSTSSPIYAQDQGNTPPPPSQPIEKELQKPKSYTLPKVMLNELMNNMVLVESGSFKMGSDSPLARKREQPVHEVTLDNFYIGKYELTQDVFTQIMGWNTSYFACEKCAVNNISWFSIQLFIERLNQATGKKFSLPTEAQWAYAAKGGNKSKGYSYSGSNNINEVAWYAENANKKSHPVGLKKPNELGLYDMTGNLWEFCLDDMSRKAYSRTESHNPFLGNKDDLKRKAMKVVRGGAYEFSATENLVFMRDGATNNVRMADIGFRLVLENK